MLCILSDSHDPAFNLAAEEYLFRNFTDDVFFLYVNDPAVVVGKHQNALAEINPRFVRENKVQVIRRLSGGGAVYHDRGNLNFSFHQTVPDPAKISFREFNLPMVEVLNHLGVAAEISQRNDIFVQDFKVSGHAEHVFRNRILSHGTLLFNAEKTALSQALKNPSFHGFQGKAIQSVRSKVANIVDFLKEPLSMNDFVSMILQHLIHRAPQNTKYALTQSDLANIEQLTIQKYATWEWNFAYSPLYRFESKTVDHSLQVSLVVEKGLMTSIEIAGEILPAAHKKAVQQKLLNSPHEYHSIDHNLSELGMKGSRFAKVFLELLF
ncbi:MAG: lipoate--protein ligase [Prolixibacteraceae bacterium]|nr:lipoate--protein ligase [Prolixibacteraceae bacterium]